MDATRQYGTQISEIARDHVKRYQFAASRLPSGLSVLDAACGCGYGSRILYDSGLRVCGVDLNAEAIDWANQHFPGPSFTCGDVTSLQGLKADVLVTFETLEHLARPDLLLEGVQARWMFASVPNEALYPFDPEIFKDDDFPHLRHYTPKQFDRLLNDCGWKVIARFCQPSKSENGIVDGTEGKFLIYACTR